MDTSRIVIGGSSAGSITALFTAYTDRELESEDRSQEVALVMDLWGGLYADVNEMEEGEPPLIIIHGTQDNIVPFSEAEKLRDRAEAVNIPYDWQPLEGRGPCTLYAGPADGPGRQIRVRAALERCSGTQPHARAPPDGYRGARAERHADAGHRSSDQ